jgi:hypothetical protein
MTNVRIWCIALITCISLAGQTSQEDLAAQKRAAEMKAQQRMAEAMQIVASDFGAGGKVVKDKPYSAEAVTETVQELKDGNRIVRHNIAKLYRDRFGRTRREQSLETLGPSAPVEQKQIVLISDPVTNTSYIVDGGAVRRFNRPQPAPPPSGRDVASLQPLAAATVKDLGKQTIEGLECAGTQTSATIPAGQIGNVRPIVTMTETWYSPEIEAVVRSTTSDPRFGETTYMLRSIQRADQPARLFEAPAEHKSN